MKSISFFFLFLFIFILNTKSQTVDTLNIYFSLNQSAVTKDNAEIIDSFFKINSRRFTSMDVDLIGFCDTIGTIKYNEKLSFQRAFATKKYIDLFNLTTLTYDKIEGYGETNNQQQYSDGHDGSLDRHVLIIIRHTDSIIPKSEISNLPIKKQPGISDAINDSTLKIGSNIILDNLNFFANSHYPLPQSMPILNEVLQAFRTNLKLKVEIQGFICCTTEGMELADNETGRYDLSKQRAKYVYDYLIKNKVDPSRLDYIGKGASVKYLPVELNRRVEFKIIDK